MQYKKRYNPKADQYIRENIYGEGSFDSIKSVGPKIFRKTAKKSSSNADSKAASKASSKLSEHAGENAGEKILELLHKKKKGKTAEMP